MSDIPGLARAQARYDAMEPPEPGPFGIVECRDCHAEMEARFLDDHECEVDED